MMAKTDIKETDKDFHIEVDLPGFKKEQIQVEVGQDNMVHISGKRTTKKTEKDQKCHLKERSEMEFARSFKLPKDVQHDKVAATYTDGVLELVIPKTEEQKPKTVKV